MAEMSWSGDSARTSLPRPSASAAAAEIGTDFVVRGHTPPPGEMTAGS
jgi:hypothetical protein